MSLSLLSELERRVECGEVLTPFSVLDPLSPETAKERVLRVLRGFREHFGEREVCVLSAPGRTELAGNHTDHQHGCVLCAAITLDTLAAVSPRADGRVRFFSEGYGESEFSLFPLEANAAEAGTTTALIRGVAAGMVRFGCEVGGFDAYICSNIPEGSGFSSSASFEILAGTIFSTLYPAQEPPAPLLAARIGQSAENVFFGKPCGLMDQSACALGGVSVLDFADPADPIAEKLDFDFGAYGYTLCTVSVGSSHADLTEEYAAIPGEMCAVAERLGGTVLRETDEASFRAKRAELLAALGERPVLRAEHYYGENARVPLMAEALRRAELPRYIELMNESGRSSEALLQNIVPSVHPEERRVELALSCAESVLRGRGAWRIHGGGFGGSILALMPKELYERFREEEERIFGAGSCRIVTLRSVGAAVVV